MNCNIKNNKLKSTKKLENINLIKDKIINNKGFLNIVFNNVSKEKLINIFTNIKQNKNTTFPDFYINDGFIELFDVSSSKENKKGSENHKNSVMFEKEYNKELETINNKEWFNDFNHIFVETFKANDLTYSIESFRESFKKHWLKHINSLNKYSGSKDNGIFLINYIGGRPFYLKNDKAIFYKLVYDSELLQFIKENRGEVRYVLFLSCEDLEIVDINLIDTLFDKCKNVDYQMGRYNEINHIIVI